MYLNQGNRENNFFCFNPAHEYLNFWLVAKMKNQIIAWLKLKIWISILWLVATMKNQIIAWYKLKIWLSIQGPDVSWLIKVHISWEGHKNLAKSPPFFDYQSKKGGDFAKILWPSQNIWTLTDGFTYLIRILQYKQPFCFLLYLSQHYWISTFQIFS